MPHDRTRVRALPCGTSPEPLLPLPAAPSPCSELCAAMDLAAPSSSPRNRFRPVLGLQRQTTSAYAPSLPCSLLQAAPSWPASCRGGERREERRGKSGGEQEQHVVRITEAPAPVGPEAASPRSAAEGEPLTPPQRAQPQAHGSPLCPAASSALASARRPPRSLE